jgi:hypothetical protein
MKASKIAVADAQRALLAMLPAPLFAPLPAARESSCSPFALRRLALWLVPVTGTRSGQQGL